ncbi:MAG: EutP/PduV family microcompartment system protein [Clostridia bacterium]|nr:EutP/PduV family microcompartment system protein [Clostridia bacterium]
MKKKIMFMGSSGAGKTTITQALYGEDIEYHKTQYVNYSEYIVDPPGEYIEDKQFGFALTLYSYEVDVIGFVLAATEQFSLYSPATTATATREVIGIVTKINDEYADRELAAEWLRIAGCEKIFFVDSVTREGLDELINYLGWNEEDPS